VEDYWNKMDIPMTNQAIMISGFPKEVEDWIFVKERKPFAIFNK